MKEGDTLNIDPNDPLYVLLEEIEATSEEGDPVKCTSTSQVTVHGIVYKIGDVLYYTRDHEYRHFGSVHQILVHDFCKVFILHRLTVKDFHPHFNAYEVNIENEKLAVKVEDLWCPWPLNTFKVRSGKQLVSIESDTEVEQL